MYINPSVSLYLGAAAGAVGAHYLLNRNTSVKEALIVGSRNTVSLACNINIAAAAFLSIENPALAILAGTVAAIFSTVVLGQALKAFNSQDFPDDKNPSLTRSIIIPVFSTMTAGLFAWVTISKINALQEVVISGSSDSKLFWGTLLLIGSSLAAGVGAIGASYFLNKKITQEDAVILGSRSAASFNFSFFVNSYLGIPVHLVPFYMVSTFVIQVITSKAIRAFDSKDLQENQEKNSLPISVLSTAAGLFSLFAARLLVYQKFLDAPSSS